MDEVNKDIIKDYMNNSKNLQLKGAILSMVQVAYKAGKQGDNEAEVIQDTMMVLRKILE